MQNECMAYLQIRDIPEDARDVLAQRAKDRGQSLNSYLRDVVLREVSFADNQALISDVVARRGDSSFTAEDVLEILATARGERSEGAA